MSTSAQSSNHILNSLAKLALDLAILDIENTDVANDLALLESVLADLVKVLVTLGETLKVRLLG